jgi:hypothetical protein
MCIGSIVPERDGDRQSALRKVLLGSAVRGRAIRPCFGLNRWGSGRETEGLQTRPAVQDRVRDVPGHGFAVQRGTERRGAMKRDQ